MHLGCVPSSLHINIALSFPSPSEPSEEPGKETRPRPSPRTERRRGSALAGRLCPTPLRLSSASSRSVPIKYSDEEQKKAM